MFVADLHNDLVQRMMIGEDVTKNTSSGHTDIERLKLSSINLEVLIVWVSDKDANISFFELANNMYDKLSGLSEDTSVVIPKSSYISFSVILNSGVKYGSICSMICRPSSVFLTIQYRLKSRL